MLMNSWVVWDTSYLDQFYAMVKGAIGQSTNVGIVILSVVAGLLVVRVIVKSFAR